MQKNRPILACATTLGLVLATVLSVSMADAFPQHRLRRWLNRPAIDPSIRDTVRFGQPSQPYRSYRAYPTDQRPVYRQPSRSYPYSWGAYPYRRY